MVSREQVTGALRRVIDHDSGHDVVSAGMISGVAVREGKVGFVITINPQDRERKAWLRDACEHEVGKLEGVESVTAVLTAEALHGNESRSADRESRQRAAHGPAPLRGQETEQGALKKPAVWNSTPLEGVRRVIAVASGKGGVGKSTTAVNLAFALRRAGKRAGLLDADIYGPSIPRMMGLFPLPRAGEGQGEGASFLQPRIVEGRMVPPEIGGIPCMSMGFITGDEAAVMRGPMISKALSQMLRATRWNDLDTLLVDMPPGTGDIHLSLAQQVPLSGAVIVTTPQAVAVADARKCLVMFRKVNVPVLGVIENMSGGIFGSGGGRALAQEAGAPFLGEIALDAGIVRAGDSGVPYAGEGTSAYDAIAAKLSK